MDSGGSPSEKKGAEPTDATEPRSPDAAAASGSGAGAAAEGAGADQAAGEDQPTGGMQRSSSVTFDAVLSVGVASSTAKTSLMRKLSGKGKKGKKGKGGEGDDDAEAPAVQQLPVPPTTRFNSSAVPARSALKSSGGAAAAAPQGADAPQSAGGAAFLAALGGTPVALPATEPPGPSSSVPLDRGAIADRGIANPLYDSTPTASPASAAPAAAEEAGGPPAAAPAAPVRSRVSFDAPPKAARFAKDTAGGSGPAAVGDTALEVDQLGPLPGDSGVGGHLQQQGDQDDVSSIAPSAAPSSVIVPPGGSEPLPKLDAQLTPRALLAGLLVGCAFALLATRLVLVAGLLPSFQVAMAASCWLILKLWTWAIMGRDVSCIAPLRAQEVAVASAVALSCAGSVIAGGFGPVVQALSQSAADAALAYAGEGAKPPRDAADLDYGHGVAWMLLVGLAGALLIVPFRRALLGRPSMTFPTGAAAGQLINTLHTPGMSYHGQKQMSRFVQWGAISFVISGYEWIFNNPACQGFAKFPTFGLGPAKWKWFFDFQMPLIGIGLIAPLGVAWSMLVGAIISWGVLWPVLDAKQGAWYPKDLQAWDARGLFGYQLCLAAGLVIADGLFCASTGSRGSGKRRWHAEALAALGNDADAMSDASGLQFGMAAMERSLRKHVFMSDRFPGVGVACIVVTAFLLIGASFALPALLSLLSSVAWWRLLVAAAIAPLAALATARAAGATDISLAPSFAAAALVVFGGWGGLPTALLAAGLILGACQAAAEMGYSFAAGFAVMAAPRAIFAGHMVGAVGGALFAPFAYTMFAPMVGLSPLALPARWAAAAFASGGVGALPLYGPYMGLAAFVVGLLLAGMREALGERARVLIPMPIAMGAVFLAGANVAVGICFGTALRVVWRWKAPRSADTYSAVVGAALIAGDGLWALGRGVLGALGVKAPICMSFSLAPTS